jgi:hypothetical protein
MQSAIGITVRFITAIMCHANELAASSEYGGREKRPIPLRR